MATGNINSTSKLPNGQDFQSVVFGGGKYAVDLVDGKFLKLHYGEVNAPMPDDPPHSTEDAVATLVIELDNTRAQLSICEQQPDGVGTGLHDYAAENDALRRNYDEIEARLREFAQANAALAELNDLLRFKLSHLSTKAAQV